MTFYQLETIVREQYYTGKHTGCRLLMSAVLAELLKRLYNPSITNLRDSLTGSQYQNTLYSIPIICTKPDGSPLELGENQWILVDANGVIITAGTIDESPTD